MKYITCGEISPKLLYPLSMALFGFITANLDQALLSKDYKHPWLVTLIMFLGETFAGFLQLVVYCRSAKKKDRINDHHFNPEVSTHMTVVEHIPDHKKCYVFGLIFICSTIDCITSIMFTMMLSFQFDENFFLNFKMYLIVFTCLFSWKYLHFRLYNHHFFSLGLICFGILSASILAFCNKEVWNNSMVMVSIILSETVISIQEVSEKWVMQQKFVNAYKLCCLEGLFGISIFLVLLIPLSVFNCSEFLYTLQLCSEVGASIENAFEAISDATEDICIIFILIGLLFCSLGFNTMRLMTSKCYSPTHRAVADTLISVLVWIETRFWKKWIGGLAMLLVPLGYGCLIFGILAYNEILIFHFWGLEKNTKVETKKRARQDLMVTANEDAKIPINDIRLPSSNDL